MAELAIGEMCGSGSICWGAVGDQQSGVGSPSCAARRLTRTPTGGSGMATRRVRPAAFRVTPWQRGNTGDRHRRPQRARRSVSTDPVGPLQTGLHHHGGDAPVRIRTPGLQSIGSQSARGCYGRNQLRCGIHSCSGRGGQSSFLGWECRVQRQAEADAQARPGVIGEGREIGNAGERGEGSR